MVNLALLVTGIMIIPAVVGGFIFAVNDKEPDPYPDPALDYEKPLSPISVWPLSYVRMYYDGIYGTKRNPELADIFSKLRNVNKENPKNRRTDKYDAWYDANIKKFCKHGEVLAYIAIYGNLTDRFIAGLKHPENNAELQKHLVSVYKNHYDKQYYLNCQNLLWYYLEHWDLLPEIKRVIMTDSRFVRALNMYNKQRGEIWV